MRACFTSTFVVLAVLLGCVSQPDGAAAAIAPNPTPALIARWEPCEPNTGVTVIVDDQKLGEGKIYVGCALGEQANGIQALEHAGFQIEGTSSYGLAFVCRIDGEPTFAEQTCEQTPGANVYWTYWHGVPGGRWGFSGCGAGSCKPALGSVEGWGFNAGMDEPAPRIEPMDGAGPHAFALPPVQESSVIPAALAREWLTKATLANVSALEEGAKTKGGGTVESTVLGLERLLAQARTLAQAGVQPAKLAPLTALLRRSCEQRGLLVEGCELRELASTSAPHDEQRPERFAAAVLGVQALGQDTESFAGMDLRAALEGMVEDASGEIESSEAAEVLAPTVLALARTGTLTAKTLESVDLLLGQQTATGQFGSSGSQTMTSVEVEAIQALVAAREQGVSVLGQTRLEAIEAALPKAGVYLESIQEQDGGVRASENSGPKLESTAQGAVGLALAGDRQAAERGARWVSQYQVTAEYAGHGDVQAGEHTPAEELIGAFAPSEGALKEALAYGEPVTRQGPATEAQAATWPALEALMTAGPYGPYDAVFDQESLFFESRTLGSPSKLTATLTNRDVRPVTIAAVGVSGAEPADFDIAGGNCAARTLAPGETCEAQVDFDPTTTGLHEAQLQARTQGASQMIQIPLEGTGASAPQPQPQPKAEPKLEAGPGPAVSPLLALTPGPNGPVGGLVVESISPVRLLLKLTVPGIATVRIAQLRGKGHHRRWQTMKTIVVKAGKAGTLGVKLPRLAVGSYRVSIGLAGAKTVVKTLTVPRGRR
jgi:hypothetical protein